MTSIAGAHLLRITHPTNLRAVRWPAPRPFSPVLEGAGCGWSDSYSPTVHRKPSAKRFHALIAVMASVRATISRWLNSALSGKYASCDAPRSGRSVKASHQSSAVRSRAP